jgi:hypothetical protein
MPEFAKVLDFTDGGHVQSISKEANFDLFNSYTSSSLGFAACWEDIVC